MDISFNSDRLKISSPLDSLAGAFSSGASAVAVVVAEPFSSLALLLLLLALDARVRGVRCDILVLLSGGVHWFTRRFFYAAFLTAQKMAVAVVVN
jgi:hypothetical protein